MAALPLPITAILKMGWLSSWAPGCSEVPSPQQAKPGKMLAQLGPLCQSGPRAAVLTEIRPLALHKTDEPPPLSSASGIKGGLERVGGHRPPKSPWRWASRVSHQGLWPPWRGPRDPLARLSFMRGRQIGSDLLQIKSLI